MRENQVRRLLGIKSRFKISALPSGMRDAIDLYFEPVFAREESMASNDAQKSIRTARGRPGVRAFLCAREQRNVVRSGFGDRTSIVANDRAARGGILGGC